MHLLFVCTGNTCRSPLAVAAWRAFGTPEITASSAGLAAQTGMTISPHSARVAQEWNQDLSGHKARFLTEKMAREADYLIGMTAEHAHALRSRFPQANVLELGDFALASHENQAVDNDLRRLLGEASGDILDPIGGSLEAYQECGAHIKRAVLGLAEALREGRI